MSRHADTGHEHIHLVVNRIQFNSAVTSDSQLYRRQEFLMRALERDLGLRQVESSAQAQRGAATKGEIEKGFVPESHRPASNSSSFAMRRQ